EALAVGTTEGQGLQRLPAEGNLRREVAAVVAVVVVTAGDGDVEGAGERQQPLEEDRLGVTGTAGGVTGRTQHHARLGQRVVLVEVGVLAVLGTDHGVGGTTAHLEDVEVHRTEDLVGDPAGIAAGGRLDRRQHIRVGAVRVAQVIVTAVGGFVRQAADDVAAAQFHVPVVGAAQAEVDADAVGQLTLEADQVVGIGRVGEVVTVAGRGEAVEVVGRQAVGGTRGAAAGAAHHATVDVVRGAVLDHHHARNRGVAAEGLDLGHAGSAVEGPVVVDLVVTANEDRGVVDLGLVGRDPVEVERAQARAGLPEGALGAVEAGHGDNGAGIPVVVVVAVGGNAEVLAADLVTGEDHAALGRGSTTDQAGAVGGSAEHDRHFLGVTAADLGRAVAVA